jgi:hypothetical protein
MPWSRSRSRAALAAASLLAALAAACSERVSNLTPVGGQEASPAEQERYVRRLYLDLAGTPPSESELAQAMAELAENGNTAPTRRDLARALMARPAFAEVFVGELENALFGGEPTANRYGLICGILRDDPGACSPACGPASDPCGSCACPIIAQLAAERDAQAEAPADLTAGASTGEIERRLGGLSVLRFSFGDPGLLADLLFETFLGRPAQADELRNARSMIQGPLLGPTQPAGVLFLRHGSSHADFVDILFDAEAYRESVVDRVFRRYLGRPASPAELRHFVALVDADDPDARPVLEAVLSSREYFAQ